MFHDFVIFSHVSEPGHPCLLSLDAASRKHALSLDFNDLLDILFDINYTFKEGCRMSLITSIIAALLALSGPLYQFVGTKIDVYKYPPLGKMVDIGGYKLHINCSGTEHSGPTVVLDAGMGCGSLDWSLVQPEIAKFARVCSYDRAGTAWSDESPLLRTSSNIAEELHAVLNKASIPGPYILVGHSSGGINMRLYTHKYLDEVAGIILVDSSHEDQIEKLPEPEGWAKSLSNPTVPLILSYIGVRRLLSHLPQVKKTVEFLPEGIRKMYLASQQTTKFIKTVCQEWVKFKESTQQLKAITKPLEIPMTVITAGKPLSTEMGLTQEYIDETNRMWPILQKDLATKSSRGKHIIAEKSGHMIPHEQPDIIVDAVRDMLGILSN